MNALPMSARHTALAILSAHSACSKHLASEFDREARVFGTGDFCSVALYLPVRHTQLLSSIPLPACAGHPRL
jgi:hypothetical protein